MGIEVIQNVDLHPDIFQMECGYFSLFINHYLFPASFRHNLSQSLGMTGVYMYYLVVAGKAKAREILTDPGWKSFKLSRSPPYLPFPIPRSRVTKE